MAESTVTINFESDTKPLESTLGTIGEASTKLADDLRENGVPLGEYAERMAEAADNKDGCRDQDAEEPLIPFGRFLPYKAPVTRERLIRHALGALHEAAESIRATEQPSIPGIYDDTRMLIDIAAQLTRLAELA